MWSPRLGLAWDVTGRGTSVMKAYYGYLYDGAVFSIWNRAVPGIGDYVTYEAFPGNRLVEIDRVSGDSKYVVAEDIDHPRTEEFNVSYEQQLWRQLAGDGHLHPSLGDQLHELDADRRHVGADGVHQPEDQPADDDLQLGQSGRDPQRFQIDNLDTVTYPGAGSIEADRDYHAGMFVLGRRFANRWQAQVSYVYSRRPGRDQRVTSGVCDRAVRDAQHQPDQPRRPSAARPPARAEAVRRLSDPGDRSGGERLVPWHQRHDLHAVQPLGSCPRQLDDLAGRTARAARLVPRRPDQHPRPADREGIRLSTCTASASTPMSRTRSTTAS